jgi:hypothetical protein
MISFLLYECLVTLSNGVVWSRPHNTSPYETLGEVTVVRGQWKKGAVTTSAASDALY